MTLQLFSLAYSSESESSPLLPFKFLLIFDPTVFEVEPNRVHGKGGLGLDVILIMDSPLPDIYFHEDEVQNLLWMSHRPYMGLLTGCGFDKRRLAPQGIQGSAAASRNWLDRRAQALQQSNPHSQYIASVDLLQISSTKDTNWARPARSHLRRALSPYAECSQVIKNLVCKKAYGLSR